MTLPGDCQWPIQRNPCDERQLHRDIDQIALALTDLCRAFEGDPDDPDDPNNHIFNRLFQRFRLTATLAQGGNAAAVKLDWDNATQAWVVGAAITVYDDDTGGMWQGVTGYEGWARQVESESAHYTIVRMFRIAYMVRGTLGGSLSGGSATLTVSSYSDGSNPGSTVTVHDPNGHWPRSGSGSKAIAFYNFEADRYEVVKCDQAEWRAKATAGEDYSPATTSISISNVSYLTHPEYTVDPTTPTVAYNTYGQSGSSGDTIYIVQNHANDQWQIITGGDPTNSNSPQRVDRFRLQSNLQIGGNAAATLLTFNGTTYVEGSTIRIFDRPYPSTTPTPGATRGMWSGIAYQEGFARRREVQQFAGGPPEYEIVWMEQFGRFIYFTLTEDMGETNPQQANATITYLFGQGDAATANPDDEIIVHDDEDLFHFAVAGAKGFAVRNEYLDTNNPGTPYYQIVVCQQPFLYGKALLEADMCPDDAATQISTLQGWSPSIYNLRLPIADEQSTVQARNTFKLAGQISNVVYFVVEYDNDAGEEFIHIVQVQHKEVSVVTGIRYNQTRKCIQAKMMESAAVMSCEDEGEWLDVLCFQRCNNIT